MGETNPKLDAELICYLVGGLEEEEARQVSAAVEAEPEKQRRLQELRQALEPLAADKDDPEPPRDLTARTIALVAEHCCRKLPRAPVPLRQSSGAAVRSWWRRADVLVAASLLLTALGLAAPGLLELRGRAARVECQNNLHTFSVALHTYKENRGHFPDIKQEAPHDFAGMVIPILTDAGLLSDKISIRCPADGHALASPISLPDARNLTVEEIEAGKLTSSYAFSLGFTDGAAYHPPCQCKDQPSNLVALMSDAPPADLGPGNSPNHGGGGQNVLFIDGSVRYYTSRTVGFQGDDIFTNKANQVAAGLDCLDIVLGRSTARP
jgi:prepilin-type processing-associated H-X9-DG protein